MQELKIKTRVYVLIFTMVSCATAVNADGLSTTFADVMVTGVAVGRSRKILDDEKHGLVLNNLGSTPVRVSIEVLTPQVGQLRSGALPIPDPRWIKINPNLVDIGPHEQKECDIVLQVPKQKQFRGRVFQVMIWSHGISAGNQGVTVSAGLLSRLRFQTKE